LAYGFLTNKDNIARMNEVELITNQYRLINEINRIKISVGFIDKIFLYSPYKEIVCSDEGIYGVNDFMIKNYNWSRAAADKLNQTLMTNKEFLVFSSDYFMGGTRQNSPISMIIVTSIMVNDQVFRLITCVNTEKYTTMILNNMSKNEEVYITNDDGEVLFTSNYGGDRSDILKSIVANKSNKSGMLQVDDHIVLFNKSGYFRGYYIRLTPLSNVIGSIQSISIVIVIELVILIAFVVSLLWFFAKMSYKPIYNILLYYRNLFNDNSEIKNEYTYIIESIGNLKTEMSKYSNKLILFNFIQSGIYQDSIADIFKYSHFAVGIIQFRDVSMVEFFFQYMHEAQKTEDKLQVEYVGIGEYKYVVIVNSNTPNLDFYYNYFHGMKTHIEKICCDTLYVAMSDVLPGCDKINLLYRHATMAGNNGICADIDKIFLYSKSDDLKMDRLYFPDSIEEKIAFAVKNSLDDIIECSINDIFEKNSRITFYMREILIMRFFNLYYRISEENDCDSDALFDIKFFEREYNIENVREYIKNMFLEITQEQKTRKYAMYKIEKIAINYINENYSFDGLNIEALAEKLGYSVPYTSKIFKMTTGLTFKEYLINKRVEEAKRLLMHSNYTIKEIAKLVGAGTYNSFVRLFKNRMGVSPGQYRNSMQGTNNQAEMME